MDALASATVGRAALSNTLHNCVPDTYTWQLPAAGAQPAQQLSFAQVIENVYDRMMMDGLRGVRLQVRVLGAEPWSRCACSLLCALFFLLTFSCSAP